MMNEQEILALIASRLSLEVKERYQYVGHGENDRAVKTVQLLLDGEVISEVDL
jgi:hypothetical protein